MEYTNKEIKIRKGKNQKIVWDRARTPVIPITTNNTNLKNEILPAFLFASAIFSESLSVSKSNPFMLKDSTTLLA